MKRIFAFGSIGMALCLLARPCLAEDPPDTALLAKEKEISKDRMLQIYSAIQDYRKDHKELPGYLSDLYPKYISDTNVFLCPTAVRLGKTLPFPELRDPKMVVQYGYEFSARPIQAMFGYSGPMTMAAWKRMQMMVAGGIVPILRCFAYDRVLNVSFDGKFYESPLQWENLVTDKINPRDLEPGHLRLVMLKQLGGAEGGETLAFQELEDAALSDRRGVVFSDKPLSGPNQKWNDEVAQSAQAVADQAAKFAAQFPKSTNASQAVQLEERMLLKATSAGSRDAADRLDALLADKLKNPDLTEDQRFDVRALQVQSVGARLNGHPDKRETYTQACRKLIHEYPKRPEPYFMLLSTAPGNDPAAARAVAEEVTQAADAPNQAKSSARALLNRLNLIGHPPDIQFTALDGRQVDVAKLKGKVVLVDFWATWCGPCVAEIPHVKAAYDKLHSRGFEIVGISLDQSKAALEKFVKSKDVPWPQYFDGQVWKNKFGQRYGIEAIPTMWLVDRNGNVVDTNARADLAGKVEKLLAAKPAGGLTQN